VAKKATTRKTARKLKKAAARTVTRRSSAKARTATATKTRNRKSRGGSSGAAKAKARGRSLPKSRLSKAELAGFREMLLEKRRSLVGDMNGIEAEALRMNRKEGSGDLSSMPTHPADLGTDNYEQEFTLGLLESERQMLGEIDEALERIRNGTYGICQGTGKPITKARLRARPWAKYSIEYARMVEQGLVHPSSEDQEDQLANDSL